MFEITLAKLFEKELPEEVDTKKPTEEKTTETPPEKEVSKPNKEENTQIEDPKDQENLSAEEPNSDNPIQDSGIGESDDPEESFSLFLKIEDIYKKLKAETENPQTEKIEKIEAFLSNGALKNSDTSKIKSFLTSIK